MKALPSGSTAAVVKSKKAATAVASTSVKAAKTSAKAARVVKPHVNGFAKFLHSSYMRNIWQLVPYSAFLAAYAGAVSFKAFYPDRVQELTLVFLAAAALIAYYIFSDGKVTPAERKWGIFIGACLAWFGFAINTGADIVIFVVGVLLTTFLGFPYWKWLAEHNKKAGDTYITAQQKEEAKVVSEWENKSWMQPDGDWYGPRKDSEAGWSQQLQIPSRADVVEFVAKNRIRMAGHLKVGVADVEMSVAKGRADLVDVRCRTGRDFLATATVWPWSNEHQLSVWDPIPFGIRMFGETIYLDLKDRHLLIGGESGSGKSNVTAMICAIGALDPYCDLYLMDGKRTELIHWRNSAKGYVQDNIDHALLMLEYLVGQMYCRYDEMGKMKPICKSAINSGGMFGPLLLVIDEIAGYIRDNVKDSEKQKRFRVLLADLLEKGRAAGIIVVANTQYPSAKLFDGGDLRAGFTYRLALRMASSEGCAMILGKGWPDFDSNKFDQDQQGMAYLIEKGTPVILRAFFVPDTKLSDMIDEAPALDPADVWGRMVSIETGKTRVSGEGSITSEAGDHTSIIDAEVVETPEFKEDWHVKLWQAIPEDEFVRESDLRSATGKTRNPVISILRRWTEQGYLEPTIQRGVTMWRKRVRTNA